MLQHLTISALGYSHEPASPGDPEEPDLPGYPHEPEVPDRPEEPTQPGYPRAPEPPDEPEAPDQPAYPRQKGTPCPSAHEAPAWFRELDHTADVGIEIAAPTLEMLFTRAAWGLFNILTDMAAIELRQAQDISVEARDRPALLVRWLSELNFLHTTQRWLFCAFEVQELSDRRLVAQARGERYDPARHTLYTEIKAVTFHDLEIRQHGNSWSARIIFDV